MPDQLAIGLWGCGNMGTALAKALLNTGRAALSVVYDLLPDAAAKVAGLCNARIASSPQDLLGHPGLAGVIVALPSYLHAPATLQAAEAGIGIFCEKPMALTVADCKAMIDAAQQHGVCLMVGQVLRYYEPYKTILRWNAEQRYGPLYAASIWRVVDGRRWAVDGYWRAYLSQCGGYLFEVAAHELDMLRCLMGRPATVHAIRQKHLPYRHEIEDLTTVQIGFEQGGSASYEGGGGAFVGRYGFRLYCERATLVSQAAFDPRALEIYTPDGPVDLLESTFAKTDPVRDELADWLAALRTGAPAPIPGQEGLATVALIEAAYRSADKGQIVTYATH